MDIICEKSLQDILEKIDLRDISFFTEDGSIRILDIGKRNWWGGPDFIDASILLNNSSKLYGDVEVHVYKNDWFRHRHHEDRHYKNVILHIFLVNDGENKTFNKYSNIKIIEINLVKTLGMKTLESLLNVRGFVVEVKKDVLWELALRRLKRKGERIITEGFWPSLAEALGYVANKIPMSILAKDFLSRLKTFPVNYNFDTILAYLLGRAGILEIELEDSFFLYLKNMWNYVFKLSPLLSYYDWYWNTRITNNPVNRIVAFAGIFHNYPDLPNILKHTEMEKIEEFLKVRAEGYWKEHLCFGRDSKPRKYLIGSHRRRDIVVNVFFPYLYVCGRGKEVESFYRFYPGLQWNRFTLRYKNLLREGGLDKFAWAHQGILELSFGSLGY